MYVRTYIHIVISPNALTFPPLPPKTTIDLASPKETHNLYLTLLTLLFAYAYDARTTQHDPTPESAWTIAALTPAFSALDPPPYSHSHSPPQQRERETDAPKLESEERVGPDFSSDDSETPRELAETLVPSYRRALAFPLYRSWALADACRMDVARFLLRGTRTILRCLLELRTILDGHEVYYVYSRIWLDDFCRWIQACARYVMRDCFCTFWSMHGFEFKVLFSQGRCSDPAWEGCKQPKHLEGFHRLEFSRTGTSSTNYEGGPTGQ